MFIDSNFDTMDWEAIGAVATFVMAIAAFVTIYLSIKQNSESRKFQIRLIQQQQAQQRFDDMVKNVLKIDNNINPFHILHYSNKLTSGTFTAEDRQALEKLAVDDDLCNTNLTLQMIRLGNYTSAQPLLHCLNSIRADYGLWSGIVNSLFQYICFSKESEQTIDMVEKQVIQMTEEMIGRLYKINSSYKQEVSSIMQQEDRPINQTLIIVKVFETEIVKLILSKKKKI